MRIALDLTPLVTASSQRGIGRYIRGLVTGISKLDDAARSGVEIFGLAADPDVRRLFVVEDIAAYCSEPARDPPPGANSRRARLVTWSLARTLPRGALFHLCESKGLPLFAPYSLTAFDLIRLLFPEIYLPRYPGSKRLAFAVERLRHGRATGIVAISHATRRDVCRMLGIDPEKVRVAWLAVDHERFRPESDPEEAARVAAILGSTAPYVLYLGAADGRKDVHTLIEAFARSRARSDAVLIVAGPVDQHRGRLEAHIRSRGLENRARVLGYIAEDVVPALYRRARVHAFVSRYEGFGLPVLEAMACGTPTITSPGSSLEELAADAALIVPCGDPAALVDALDRLFYDDELRGTLRARGMARARTFTWEACARETMSLFRSLPKPRDLP